MIEGHGNDINNYNVRLKADFSSNINCHTSTSFICNYLNKKIHDAITKYPQPQPYKLEKHLSETHRIKTQELCVTSGATEAIYLIAQAFKGKKSAIMQPTFSEYQDACKIHGHLIHNFCNILYQDLSEFNLCWLCNPNNPTGQTIPYDTLEQTILRNPNTIFVIDQSYEHFTHKPLFSAYNAIKYPNIILIHSFTKRYAVPGLRLGYVTACETIIKHLHQLRMPWSVNSLAIETGLLLADNIVMSLPYLSQYLKDANLLRINLQNETKIYVLPTDTHFMLCRLPHGNSAELKNYLITEYKLLIRDAANFVGLDNHYFRIATQTREMNDLLVSAIKKFLER